MESSYTYNESVNDKRKSREYLSERLFLNLFVSRTKILSHFDRRQSLASAFALLANWSLKISVTISEIGKSEEISSFSFCSTTPILKIVLEYSFNCVIIQLTINNNNKSYFQTKQSQTKQFLMNSIQIIPIKRE
jgi:hypothetical protein